jgi:predicted DNA-binding protein with PD1-like motif
MRYSRFDAKSFVIRIEKEEEVISALQSFCKEKRIGNAFFWGIGSVADPILAHYNPRTKKYTEKKLTGIFELISLHGNACWYDNDILIHKRKPPFFHCL